MRMNDVGDELNDDVIVAQKESQESEQKMLELMEQMQRQASAPEEVRNVLDTSVSNNKDNISLTVKTEDDTNYWDIDEIPTRYKLYPDGTTIKARPLKVIEIKKLTAMTDDNADSIVNDILRKSIRGIDVNEIYSVDKMYLLLWLRANSFRDNRYVVGFTCDHCHTESSYHFEIGNVEVDFLDDEYDPNRILTMSNGDDIKIKLLQIKDELALHSFNIKYRSMLEKGGEKVDDDLLAISFMIDQINGVEVDPVDRYNYILNMMPQDFSALTTLLGEITVGIKSNMTVECTKCGGESQIGITFHPDFFLPLFKAE